MCVARWIPCGNLLSAHRPHCRWTVPSAWKSVSFCPTATSSLPKCPGVAHFSDKERFAARTALERYRHVARGDELNESYCSYFAQLLAKAQAAKIEVRVLLLPVHPVFADALGRAAYDRFKATLGTRIIALCKQYGADCRDFTRLASFQGVEDGFLDGVHMDPDNIRRMTNVLFALRPKRSRSSCPLKSKFARPSRLANPRAKPLHRNMNSY